MLRDDLGKETGEWRKAEVEAMRLWESPRLDCYCTAQVVWVCRIKRKDSSRHAALVNMLNLVGSQHEMQRVTACMEQSHSQELLTSC